MTGASLDWLSMVLLVMLAADFVVGFKRGFVRQLFDLVGIIIAVLAAVRYKEIATAYVMAWMPNIRPVVGTVMGFLAVLFGTLLLVELISHALGLVASAPGVSVLNNLGGAALRVGRGCLLISVALTLVLSLNIPAVTRAVERSELAMRLVRFAPAVWTEFRDYVPHELGIPGTGGLEDGTVKPGDRGVL